MKKFVKLAIATSLLVGAAAGAHAAGPGIDPDGKPPKSPMEILASLLG